MKSEFLNLNFKNYKKFWGAKENVRTENVRSFYSKNGNYENLRCLPSHHILLIISKF